MPQHIMIFLIFEPEGRMVIEFRHIHFGGEMESGKGVYYVP